MKDHNMHSQTTSDVSWNYLCFAWRWIMEQH